MTRDAGWEGRLDEYAAARRRESRLHMAWLYWLIRRLPEEQRGPVVAAILRGDLPLDFERQEQAPSPLPLLARPAIRLASVVHDPSSEPEPAMSPAPIPAVTAQEGPGPAAVPPGGATDEVLRAQLDRALAAVPPDLCGADARIVRRQSGKVRECLILADGRRVIITTDRISAFDVVLGTLPFKGQVLSQLAAAWFRASAHVAPNHLLATPDPNVMVVRECAPYPVEMVVRAYLTGVTSTSIWHAYSGGERVFCGHRLPDGLRKNEALPAPILTPSTKAEVGRGHDESVSGDELLRRGLLDGPTLERMSALCHALFAFGQEQALRRGLILVDTKYELGRATGPDGQDEILFIDEIHTPDSSRYWFAEDYQERLRAGQEPRSLDKEFVRRHLADAGYRGEGPPPPLPDEVRVEAARRYIEAYERLLGAPFAPDARPPLQRIEENLKEFLR